MTKLHRLIRIAFVLAVGLTLIVVLVISHLWKDRADVAEMAWPLAESVNSENGNVTVTWLGITTLLFDDGVTQIMIDGTITRLGLSKILTLRKVSSDIANINLILAEYRIDRLAAIVPVHSHFDHAIDVGHIANRTSAVVLGSDSTANIARGAGVPVDQYQTLANGESRQFGAFTITLIESRHAPIGIGENSLFPGDIDEPLVQPARVTAWQEGISYSVVIGHPRGTTLVQGSGGYVKAALRGVSADVVMLGIAGLQRLGREYTNELWRETVVQTGARRVYPVHYEDLTQPFGQIQLFPRFLDNVVETAGWLDELAAEAAEPVVIQRLPFGEPVVLY